MKKYLSALIMLICLTALIGCGKNLDFTRSTVYIAKDASVVSVDVEDFGASYYSEEELNTYLSENIDDYTKNNGETVKLDEVTVSEDAIATVKISYDTVEDYERLNGLILYTGTAAEAAAKGYSLNGSFYAVSSEGAEVATYTPADDDLIVISDAGHDVCIDGKVQYMSVIDGATPYVSESLDTVGYDEEDSNGRTYIVVYTR